MTEREIGPVWIAEYYQPNRKTRRSAMRTLRHNTVLYHQEIDRIRALHSARQAKRFAKTEALRQLAEFDPDDPDYSAEYRCAQEKALERLRSVA